MKLLLLDGRLFCAAIVIIIVTIIATPLKYYGLLPVRGRWLIIPFLVSAAYAISWLWVVFKDMVNEDQGGYDS